MPVHRMGQPGTTVSPQRGLSLCQARWPVVDPLRAHREPPAFPAIPTAHSAPTNQPTNSPANRLSSCYPGRAITDTLHSAAMNQQHQHRSSRIYSTPGQHSSSPRGGARPRTSVHSRLAQLGHAKEHCAWQTALARAPQVPMLLSPPTLRATRGCSAGQRPAPRPWYHTDEP